MKKTFLIMGLLALGLAACGGSGAPEEAGTDSASTDDGAAPLPKAVETSGAGSDSGMDQKELTIPSALRGRWGMNASDCDVERSDATGLLTVGDRTLEFYESVGRLTKAAESDARRLRGTFAFTGEGMAWQRDVVLELQAGELQDGGTVLIRREFGADAAPDPFRYERCAS